MFEKVHFKGSWRPYQKRILDRLPELLKDKKLHIVAAPGSGKTILGLEALIRLKNKTLVLAPTITIREQWIQRFNTFFYHGDETIITNDLHQPKEITVATYQGLHAAINKLKNIERADEESEDSLVVVEDYANFDLFALLKREKIKTIVLDEAHHLRSEWWKSLMDLVDKLKDVIIISLTATPPYDVDITEWEKYKALCGAIDAEIYVPELVADKNLCPHQDYVYFNYPTEAETEIIREYRMNVNRIVKDILNNEKLIDRVKKHRFVTQPLKHLEEILKAPEYYTSFLVYLKQVGVPIEKTAIEVLGKSTLPKFDRQQVETLLRYLLFVEQESMMDESLNHIKKQLTECGCIERKQVLLQSNSRINKLLITSVGKLNSIIQIVKSELDSLKDQLHMVILTDYIRKEVIPKTSDDLKSINSVGVGPIFETLRRLNMPNLKLGVLSGSLIIIPKSSLSQLMELLTNHHISTYTIRDLLVDPNYCEFELSGESNKQKVDMISSLFSTGEINVLIGTKSLLGEGWDEVSINSLIMASFVGTYMLSNQMRGRAIRVDRAKSRKTANIWHLVCIEKEELYQTNMINYIDNKLMSQFVYGKHMLISDDYETLKRRFKGFVGVAYDEDKIENGIDRISIITPPYTQAHITEINQEMLSRSKERDELYDKWFRIIGHNLKTLEMVEDVTVEESVLPKKFLYLDSISLLIVQAAFAFYYICVTLGIFRLVYLLLIVNLVCLPFIVKAATLYLRFGSMKRHLKGVATALLNTLIHLQYIQSKSVQVRVEDKDKTSALCYLDNATTYEKTLFNECLEELFGVIINPRYLINRIGVIRFIKTNDYLALPGIIGKNKDGAEFFANEWEKHVGPNRLIYTRDIQGRKTLLYARIHSLSYQSLDRVERKLVVKNKWK